MNPKYEQEEDAQREAAVLNEKPLGFCPVINAVCRVECVAFKQAYVRSALVWVEAARRDEQRHEVVPSRCDYIRIFVS